MGIIEKIIIFLTVLAILFVGGTVAAFSFMPPRSGIPKVAVDSEIATDDWLDKMRQRHHPRTGAPLVTDFGVGEQIVEDTTSGSPGKPQKATKEVAQKAKAEYWGGSDSVIPQNEQVKGIPWLRKVPGVKYAKPRKVPLILYKKYQTFEDSFKLAKEGGGEFVETAAGTAYQVNWVDQNSYLFTKIGIRRGDKVISVNGQPVGKSPAAGRALFESLKGEKHFSALVERKGQQLVLSYTVGS